MKVLETYDNLSYEITDEQHQIIFRESAEGKKSGIWIGKDYIAFGAIKAIHENLHGYGQEYQALPPKGFTGIINKAPNAGLEAMARGLKKFIKSHTEKATPQSDELLQKMRQVYAQKKA